MTFHVRFTDEALDDLQRIYAFQLERSSGDWRQAEAAIEAIRRGLALLETSPFACRRAPTGDPLLRELLIGFGATGYVLLFDVGAESFVTVLAARHQREEDYR